MAATLKRSILLALLLLPLAQVQTASAGDKPSELSELSEDIDANRTNVFYVRARLLRLREQILDDAIADAHVVILHHDDMGSNFVLESIIYRLDGDLVHVQDNSAGQLASKRGIELFVGRVLPGNHVLSVEVRYRGNSEVFDYLNRYTFRLRANYTYFARTGKRTTVHSTGFLRGDPTYDLTQRPYIKFKAVPEPLSVR